MKKSNAKQIKRIIKELEDLAPDLETVVDYERDALEGRSDKWRASDKGMEAEDEVETIQNAHNALQEALVELNGLKLD